MRISRKTVTEDRRDLDGDPVVQGILKAISLQRIRPGTKLGEEELAHVFDTSRMRIRQVLAHLASRNIVNLIPNRGAFVWEPTPAEARELFAARRVLERATVEALIDHLTEDAAAALKQHNHQEAVHDRSDRWASLALTGDYHVLIARLAGNRVMLNFVTEIMLRNSLIIAKFETPGSLDCSPDAHPQITERILARDRARAADLMEAHLHEIEARLHLDAAKTDPEDIAAIFADLGVARPRRRAR